MIYIGGSAIGTLIDCVPTISANTVITSFPSLYDMALTIQKTGNKLNEYKLNIDTSSFEASQAAVDTTLYTKKEWVIQEDDGYLGLGVASISCILVDYVGKCDNQDQGTITLSFVPLMTVGLYPSESLYPSNILYPM